MNKKIQHFDQPTIQAAKLYLMRSHGFARPDGKRDNGGRWYPHGRDAEVIANVREPSRAWPNSLYKAAFSAAHCAAFHDANPTMVRRLVNLASKGVQRFGSKEAIEDALAPFSHYAALDKATGEATGQAEPRRL